MRLKKLYLAAVAATVGLAATVAQAGTVGTTFNLTSGQGTVTWTLTDAAPQGDASLDVWTLNYSSTGGAATTYAFNLNSETTALQVTSPAFGVNSNVYKNSNQTLDTAAGFNLTVPAGKSSVSDTHFLVNTNTDGVLININPTESSTGIKVDSLGFASSSPINLNAWDFAKIVVPDATTYLSLAMEAVRGSDGRITDLRSGVQLQLVEATPVPIPAVLPAGALLLCGLFAGRRTRATA